MAKITIEKLVEILSQRKGATFISLVSETAPKMRKTANPYYGRVTRLAERSGMVGVCYESAVNRQREREGHDEYFTAESMWGGKGERINSCFCRHKETGKIYLVFYPTKVDNNGKPIASQDRWSVDGRECDPETYKEIKRFLPEHSAPKQELTKEIPWRVFGLETIRQLKIDGQIYEICQ